ncbi:MAG: penicillin-binding protein 2 [Verrucomicrobia bacterium]|nr:penicillin-binding protein 2 [Verrucomicrobiota bacterium]MBU1736328.1 penicillin-binding protein 2 [Verrucomicrobiota bacterium]MBU1857369.1 penicillin-binding protein 2 [Verrucomicrobiota bacterium]
MSLHLTTREHTRLRRLKILILSALGILVIALWYIQVGHGEHYANNLEQQSVRRVRIPGVRGKIYDRQGVCLADNAPNYGIALYLEELGLTGKRRNTAMDTRKTIHQIAAIIGHPPQIDQSRITDHLYSRKALPLVAWRHVDEQTMARLAESGARLPGVDIVVDADRVYPQGHILAHLLGYVGTAEIQSEEDELYHYYLPDLTGKTGLEKRFDELLTGRAGGRLVQVDVIGFKHDETTLREPVPGGDLKLTIDLRIQRAAEQAMGDTVGAIVVVDPRNGDVLAMVSTPDFDPNLFCSKITQDNWNRLLNDPRKPLFNRALNGLYAPGSVFKPLVALAALEQGVDPDLTLECPGYFELGNQRFACYMDEAHGRVNFRRAIRISCNVFFYQLGLKCRYDSIYNMALATGFGQKTGISLDGESAGLLPGKAWKRQTFGEAWRDGDTCNIAVGQGALQVTPLQMAMLTATIANDGCLYQPRLVMAERDENAEEFKEIPPVVVRHMHWPADHLALVKNGMRDVIQDAEGTGRLAQLEGIAMAGKTGTAEYGRKGTGQKHGWMILFAPFEHPRYAVAIVMDDAVSGGISVGPRMRQLMREILAGEGNG